MTPEEQKEATKSGRLIRAARKQNGLTQHEVAKGLGVSQSMLSKLESATLMPSAANWYMFCKMVGIAPDSSWRTGMIDRSTHAVLDSRRVDGTFKLPRRYGENRGTKVRTLIPLLRYFERKLGASRLDQFLESVRMDRDFFIILDNQINLNFSIDMAKALMQAGVLGPGDYTDLTACWGQADGHGSLAEDYEKATRLSRLFAALDKNVRKYDINFDYTFESVDENQIDISVKPEAHLASFKYRGDEMLGDYFCRVRKHAFQAFSGWLQTPNAAIEEIECHYRDPGIHRCLYQLKTA